MDADKISEFRVDAESRSSKSPIEFFGSVKRELKNISWTTREELRKYTKIIVVSTFASGFAIYFFDVLIQRALWISDALIKWIFG